MGLASDNYKHKQDNFFLFFPMYVCLGVYYVLYYITYPITWIWNTLSDTLYNNVSKSGVDTSDLRGAYITEKDKIEAEAAQASDDLNKNYKRKEVKISDSLIKARENLINSIDAGEEQRSDKPRIYRYTALAPDGRQVTNTFYAYSKVETYTFLENEGYKVFKIETSDFIEKIYGTNIFGTHKIRIKDIVFWLQQLSTYLKAGIPLTDAMRILSRQMGKNHNIKRTFDSVVYNLTLGESFSTALEKQGDAFPGLLVNMVKSAEATGDLEGTLDEMADYYKSTETTRKEMISALTYPCLVVVFSIAVVIFLLIYIIPQFVSIYETAGVSINPITAFIISASDFLSANIYYIILVVVIFFTVIYVLYKNVKAFRYFLQTVAMKLPVIGKVIIYKEMMIFTKTFSSLLRNNVFITDSMDILGHITNNEVYREIMINTVNYIGRGEKISLAFQGHWAIPEVAYYMMVTGESTGQLAEMMGKVSDYYAEQHKMIVNSLKTLIEPILIIMLAVVVGGIMIAVIVPIFQLYGSLMDTASYTT